MMIMMVGCGWKGQGSYCYNQLHCSCCLVSSQFVLHFTNHFSFQMVLLILFLLVLLCSKLLLGFGVGKSDADVDCDGIVLALMIDSGGET